jgi:ribonuclease VapC
MIAVDMSALMAIVTGEAEADACIAVLEAEDVVYISAGTFAEALIVAARRGVGAEMSKLVVDFGFDVVPVTQATARRIAMAYDRWGKGVDPAGLNFGDCFAYEVAQQNPCKLLYVGNDFGKTDIAGALPVQPGFSPE